LLYYHQANPKRAVSKAMLGTSVGGEALQIADKPFELGETVSGSGRAVPGVRMSGMECDDVSGMTYRG